MTTLSIPSTVETIGAEAFSGVNFTDITIDAKSLTTVGSHAFYGLNYTFENLTINSLADWSKVSLCEAIAQRSSTTVKFVKENITIQRSSWNNPKLEIPEGVVNIGNYAFSNMYLTGGVSFPRSLETIGDHAFDRAMNSSGTNPVALNIPASVTEIGAFAFYSCNNIYEVNIGRSVTTIGDNAFGYCKFKSIYIPSSVTSIGYNAFTEVSSIKSVTYDTKSPVKFFEGLFNSTVLQNATLYVPEGAQTAMKQTTPWSRFSTLEEKVPEFNLWYDNHGYVLRDNTLISSGSVIEKGEYPMVLMILPDAGYQVEKILENDSYEPSWYKIGNNYYVYCTPSNLITPIEVVFSKIGEASVAVSSPDNHTVTYTCPEGNDITVAFAPQSGWMLHSVTLNGEPVEFGDDNTVMLSSISGENELNAIYIQDSNTDEYALELEVFDPITIALSGHILSVRNKPADASVLVYDLAGNIVAYGTTDELYVPLSNEVAIIKVGDKVFKVVVR